MVLGQAVGVVDGLLVAGVGIVVQPQVVEGLVELVAGAIRRALESQVLQEVRDAHQLRGLISRAGADKNTDPGGVGGGVANGQEGQAIGERVLLDRHERMLGVGHSALGKRQRLEGVRHLFQGVMVRNSAWWHLDA